MSRVEKYDLCKWRELKIQPLQMEGWNKPRLCMLGVLCPAGGAGWAAQEAARVLRDQDEADYHKRWSIKKGNGACTCSLHMWELSVWYQNFNITNSWFVLLLSLLISTNKDLATLGHREPWSRFSVTSQQRNFLLGVPIERKLVNQRIFSKHHVKILIRIRLHMWARSSIVVRASDCQCTSCNGPGFDPSIRWHSGNWRAADEAVLNIVRKKQKIPPKNILTKRIRQQIPSFFLNCAQLRHCKNILFKSSG